MSGEDCESQKVLANKLTNMRFENVRRVLIHDKGSMRLILVARTRLPRSPTVVIISPYDDEDVDWRCGQSMS
jgi:citrate lyase gamma subunit